MTKILEGELRQHGATSLYSKAKKGDKWKFEGAYPFNLPRARRQAQRLRKRGYFTLIKKSGRR